MIAISGWTRPHIDCWCHGPCWCNPTVCESCGGIEHRVVDLRPADREYMAIFSEQLMRH